MKIIKWMILTLVVSMATSRPAKAQDMEAAQELQDLMTKMSTADDICPFMPRLRILVNRIAKSVPEVYEAMKPQLDEFNKTGDETCSGTGANQQAAQQDQVSPTAVSPIPAVADAKAPQDRAAAQRPGGARGQGTGDKLHCAGASGADVGYNNGCQLVPGTNSGTSGSQGGSTSTNSSNAGSAGTASFTSPIAATCVRLFWDPRSTTTLVLQNNCGQPIRAVYILPNRPGAGLFVLDFAVGDREQRIGFQDGEDVARSRGSQLSVCPYDYNPVGANDQPVNHVVTSYRCKKR